MSAEPADAFPPLMRDDAQARPAWLRVLYGVLAVVCFVAGVVGWLVPVITGIPFYVAGLVFLGKASPWCAHRVNRWETRLPPRLRRALRWRPGSGKDRGSDASSDPDPDEPTGPREPT